MRGLVVFCALWSGTALAAAPDSSALAKRVDQHLATRWEAEKVTPAGVVDDARFARRVYLDLVGRIPTAAEVRTFVDDKTAEKRVKLVATLLGSASYGRHWTTFWRREWIPQADVPGAMPAEEFDSWLAVQLRDGAPYDRMVRELLSASTRGTSARSVPTTFLAASSFRPEELAANSTRAFLGVNLDCAQCHNHPFARWKREQFWQTAAFFVRPTDAAPARLELMIPDTKTKVSPRLLIDPQPTWPAKLKADTGRVILADWMTAKTNPYFSRNAANRVWANLFGTGLVEPLDDLGGDNTSSHPELLDELAKSFADSGFDLKYLIAALTQSRAYQLAAVPAGDARGDPRLFAAAKVRAMTGEQLYASLHIAAGASPDRDDLDAGVAPRRRRFLEKFRIERASSSQRSILQAMSMMNGDLTAELTDPAKSPALRAVAESPFLDADGKIETLYLAALGRTPTAAQRESLVKYLESQGERQGLADILWALLNSSEFSTNH